MVSNRTVVQRQRRAEWIASKGGCCEKCGSTEHLQMHHRVKEEKESHAVWGLVKERRDAELMKCDLLCRKCHVAHHAKERMRHGRSGYERRACRCASCTRANTVSSVAYGKRRSEKLRAAGLCVKCTKPNTQTTDLCRPCTIKKVARARAKREARKAQQQ